MWSLMRLLFPAKDQVVSSLPSQLAATGETAIPLSLLLSSLPAVFADTGAALPSEQHLGPSPVSESFPSALPQQTNTSLGAAPLPLIPESIPLNDTTPSTPPDLPSPPCPLIPAAQDIALPASATLPNSPQLGPPSTECVPSQPTDSPVLPPPPMTTRSQTSSLKPKKFPGFKLFHSKHPLFSFHSVLPELEPTCYSKAANDPRWKTAMSAEFAALVSNKTWTLCPRPPHRHVIHNKWVYKIKMHADGSVERFKARLVAKGFEHQSWIDYIETFSHVIKPATIRLMLALTGPFANWTYPMRFYMDPWMKKSTWSNLVVLSTLPILTLCVSFARPFMA
jgi:hypothetical protein